jgi:bacillithiol biosynthesis cysteine-adding enzyme BshC
LTSDFFDRPEFRPRVPLDGAGRSVWLPLHPRFRFPAPGREGAVAVPEGLIEPPPPAPWLLEALKQSARRSGQLGEPGFDAALARLAAPGARMVVTGQQAGFLGGPLLTLYKALSAIGAARALERETGRPHLAVFWIVGEDHDLEEIAAVRFPAPSSAAGAGSACLALPLETSSARRPASSVPVGGAALEVLDAARRLFAERPFEAEVEALIAAYAGGADLASAFGRLMAALLGRFGLVFIEPEPLRAAARPLVRRALERPGALLEAIERGRREMESLGVEPPAAGRFPLFLIEDGPAGRRHHLKPSPGGFVIEGSGEEVSSAAALDLLERSPERFSAGVLLRPVIQQALLPVAAAIGGPAEIAYHGQLGPVFEFFGVPRTPVALRLGATLIEPRAERAAARLALVGPELSRLARVRTPEDLVPRDPDLEARLDELRRSVAGGLEVLIAGAGAPPQQAEDLRSGARKLEGEIDRFGGRLRRAALARRQDLLGPAETLWKHLFPDGVLQERRWNALHYISLYGTAWIDSLLAAVERQPWSSEHRWLYLEGTDEH